MSLQLPPTAAMFSQSQPDDVWACGVCMDAACTLRDVGGANGRQREGGIVVLLAPCGHLFHQSWCVRGARVAVGSACAQGL